MIAMYRKNIGQSDQVYIQCPVNVLHMAPIVTACLQLMIPGTLTAAEACVTFENSYQNCLYRK